MLTPYEESVVYEIAVHMVKPNLIQKSLALVGKPATFLLEKTRDIKGLRAIPELVTAAVESGLKGTIKAANNLSSEKAILDEFCKRGNFLSYSEVISSELEIKDQVADTYDLSNALLVGTEGVVMGLAASICEGVPGAQVLIPAIVTADVASSMVFLTRHICQIATSYGYSSNDPRNVPHVIAAMAPHTSTSDEGYLLAKYAVIEMNSAASKFVAHQSAKAMQEAIAKGNLPQLIKLIAYVAERLGVLITEKELGMLVPVAGALLNGSVNVAFQQVGHTTGKDYFRRQHLALKYGEEAVLDRIEQEIEKLKAKTA